MRDPYWAELSELGLSVRQDGWAQLPGWQQDAGGRRPGAGRPETVRLTDRQWSLVVFALESRGSDVIPGTVRPEYVEMLKNIASRRRLLAVTLRQRLVDDGLSELPVVR